MKFLKIILPILLITAFLLSLTSCDILSDLIDLTDEPAGASSPVSLPVSDDPASGETTVPSASETPDEPTPPSTNPDPAPNGSYYDLENVVRYLNAYGKLPGNYITKKDAEALGWTGGTPESVKPGSAIGGDYFGNNEKKLPAASGRRFTECDLDTLGAKGRGAKRLVFSNDGLYFYTDDHYESFTEVILKNDGTIEFGKVYK